MSGVRVSEGWIEGVRQGVVREGEVSDKIREQVRE